MYLTKVFLVLVTIFGSSTIWRVEGLRHRRTTKPSWINYTSTIEDAPKNEDDTRSFPYPTKPPQITQAPIQYPNQHPPHYPVVSPQPIHLVTIVDQFDHRYPDGSYEFRYELTDQTVRYERGYFISHQYKNILVVKGYYSYRLPDLRYLTVFYTADQNGYRQDSSKFSTIRPQLPQSLNVGSDPHTGANLDFGGHKSIHEEE